MIIDAPTLGMLPKLLSQALAQPSDGRLRKTNAERQASSQQPQQALATRNNIRVPGDTVPKGRARGVGSRAACGSTASVGWCLTTLLDFCCLEPSSKNIPLGCREATKVP